MSPQKIMLDTNVLKNVSRGSVPTAEALKRYVKAGAKIYIAKTTYDELIIRAPTPRMRDQYRRMLKELGIEVAPNSKTHLIAKVVAKVLRQKSDMKARGDFYADNAAHQYAEGEPGQITQYRREGTYDPGDVFVAAEAKRVNAQLWTSDERFAKRARNLGVPMAPESFSIKGISGTEDPERGLELLGIDPEPEITALVERINLNARAVRALQTGSVRESAATAGEVALTLGLAIAMWLIRFLITKRIMNDIIKDGLKRVGKEVETKLNGNLKRTIANEQLNLDPGDKVYANVIVRIHFIERSLGAGRGNYTEPEVRLADVNITTNDVKREREFEVDRYEKVKEFTQSFEVAVYTEAEIDQFRSWHAGYLDSKRQLGRNPTDIGLREQTAELRKRIVQVYGADVGALQREADTM